MPVEVQKNDLKIICENLKDKLKSQYIQNQIGITGVHLVQGRTRKGIDIFGNKFKPYSKSYARKRRKLNLFTNIVNLKSDANANTGMVNNLTYTVSSDFSTVLIHLRDKSKEKLARFHQILGAGKSKVIRQWVGFTKKQNQQLQEHTSKVVKNIISNLSR